MNSNSYEDSITSYYNLNPLYGDLPELGIDIESILENIKQHSYLIFAQKAADLLAKSKHIYISDLYLDTASRMSDDIVASALVKQTVHNVSFKITQIAASSDIECSFVISDKLFEKDKNFMDHLCGIDIDKRNLDSSTKMIIRFGYIFWKIVSSILNELQQTNTFTFNEIRYDILKTFQADVLLERITCMPKTYRCEYNN